MPYLLALTLLITPAYVIKFNLLGFPANLLMVWVIFMWLVFFSWIFFKKNFKEFCYSIISVNKKLALLVSLFFVAGIVSLFVHGFDRQKLGQFIVLFLQPISLFFISRYTQQKHPKTKALLLNTCYLLLAASGLYAILQYFTLIGLPPAWWGNNDEPKRALSFFVHPNFYSLFAAPLLALLLPDVFNKFSIFNFQFSKFWKPLFWLVGALGLFLSLSRAGWMGLATAIGIYLIAGADKKIRQIIFAVGIIIAVVVIVTPNFRYRLLLPFYGEKSAVSRFSLWQTGWKGVKQSPLTGLGLTGFSRQWTTLNTDPGLTDTHNFPHNIFLDVWVETGLLGLISFLGIILWCVFQGLRNRQNIILLGVSLFLLALLVQGQIDNPYFKNDLALVFWIILSLV